MYFITGDIASGKSTVLCSIYNKIKTGDGFFNRKVFSAGNYSGQEIVRISTGECRLFSFLTEFIPLGWDEICRYKNHSFSRAGLLFAQSIARKAENERGPFFFDELGPLELAGEGLCRCFESLLLSGKDIYAVVRRGCLDGVTEKFGVRDYGAIYCSPKRP